MHNKTNKKSKRLPPENFSEFFSSESDEQFKSKHPIGYRFLVALGIMLSGFCSSRFFSDCSNARFVICDTAFHSHSKCILSRLRRKSQGRAKTPIAASPVGQSTIGVFII